MGYYNMIYQYGESNFFKNCEKSGVLIVVDLPWQNKFFSRRKNLLTFYSIFKQIKD